MSTLTVESIHPYVYKDLRDSTIVPLFDWVEICLGRDFATIHQWATEIEEQKWYHDTLIQGSLMDYCTTKEETRRYAPFVNIGNRILSLAHCRLPEMAETKSYPIDDLCFGDSSSREVKTIPEHGKLGAKRKLDIVMVRKFKAEGLKAESGSVEWSDIFFWWEIEGHRRLTDVLDAERKQQGLSSVDDWRKAEDMAEIKASAARMASFAGNPYNNVAESMADAENTPEVARASYEHLVKQKTDQGSPNKAMKNLNISGAPHIITPDLSSAEARAAVKRKLEDRDPDDILAGMDIRSSILAWNSQGTEADLVRGRQGAAHSTGYALEHSSCTRGTRVFSLAAVIKEDRVFFWRYSPNGILYTTTHLSLITDFSLVAAIMVAIALLTPEQFGAVPVSIFSPPNPSYSSYPLTTLENCTLRLRDPAKRKPVSFTLQKNIFAQYTLMGRRTFLYKAIADPPIQTAENVIIKFSYQHAACITEPELLRDAANAGVSTDHLPEIYLAEDLWVLEDVQREVYRLRQRNEASKAEPAVLQEPQYDDRVLRAIVYTEYLPIKTLFAEFPELIPVMVDQIMDCLHELRTKARILHRDISVNNIMWTIQDGKLLFKLIDFDNAARLPDEAEGESKYTPTARTRSGTLPFMAHELVLDAWTATQSKYSVPIEHFVRHDYESLFFVSLWCVEVLYADSMDAAEAAKLLESAKALESGTLGTLSALKQVICTRGLGRAFPIKILPEPAECLLGWFTAWTTVFSGSVHDIDLHEAAVTFARIAKRDPPSIDLETVNGTITYDALKIALSEHAPPQRWTIDELMAKYTIRKQIPSTSKAKPTTKPKTRAKRAKKQQQVTVAVNSMLSRLRPRKKPAGTTS